MYKIRAKTLFVGKSVIFLPSCHSTNSEALNLLNSNDIDNGTIVITDTQLSGKGQRDNTWESRPGENLTFSIILRPSFLPVMSQFDMNIAITLGYMTFYPLSRAGLK